MQLEYGRKIILIIIISLQIHVFHFRMLHMSDIWKCVNFKIFYHVMRLHNRFYLRMYGYYNELVKNRQQR